MSESRSLPGRPNLRYLKLEARRRLAAGEFPALHDAQAAIAREHGVPTWSTLRKLISSKSEDDSHALAQLRWMIARFRDAGEVGWAAPDGDELGQHFDERFLAVVPASELVAQVRRVAADLRAEPVVTSHAPLEARIQLASMEIFASAGADPPHRLTGLRAIPLGARVTDVRVAVPLPGRTRGEAPAEMPGLVDGAVAELGLPALVLAGGGPDIPAWVVAKGWADLDRAEVLDTGYRLPACGVTALVTGTAVLRLVAESRFGLDSPVNDYLRTVRLADDTITVRELLSYTAGVDSPNPAELFAENVPHLTALVGPVIGCGGPRGVVQLGSGGYAVLGQLIADVTGSAYAGAATRLVLEPLGMSSSSFPGSLADLGPSTVTGYDLTPEGAFVQVPAMLCTVPAVGGLWATASDLVRLGTGWSSLLPASLAREALTPQAPPGPGGRRLGLGWLIPRGDIAVHAGTAQGAAASLLVRIRDNQVRVTMTSRLIALDHIHHRVLRSWTTLSHEESATRAIQKDSHGPV